jgi:hypothetical protein
MRTASQLLVLILVAAAAGQKATDFALPTNRANVICSATVKAVEPPTTARNTFLIHFKVDDGLRGVQAGEEVVVSEWSGRWQSGVERYRAGESYLLFLASDKGSSSLVGGENGRLRITKGLVTVDSAEHSERAMRLRTAARQQVPYREVADTIRAAMCERP